MAISRRRFGQALMFGPAIAGAGAYPALSETLTGASPFRLFVPGYYPASARYQGQSVKQQPDWQSYIPAAYTGPRTMLTRVSEAGQAPLRAVYPIQGHGLALHPDGKRGFFAANKHPDNPMIAFDTQTLAPIKTVPVNRKGWYGGGHAIYSHDGKYLLVSERSPDRAYEGRVEAHFGRITVRDAYSYEVLDEYSSHGISPHEITLSDDGRYLLIANYGSPQASGHGIKKSLPQIIEPSLVVLDMQDGQLLEKAVGADSGNEIRHLTAANLDQVFAIQARLGDERQFARFMQDQPGIYERDITARKNRAYLPALPLHLQRHDAGASLLKEVGGIDVQSARHGLSIIHDSLNDEVLASFPSAHVLMIFDASTAMLKRRIQTSDMGLNYPCGLALHPDSKHYIVTGYWRNMYVFERGSHRLNRAACQYLPFFGHSHTVAV